MSIFTAPALYTPQEVKEMQKANRDFARHNKILAKRPASTPMYLLAGTLAAIHAALPLQEEAP